MLTTPLYRQVYDQIRQRISAGVYARGSALPSETRLGQEFGVSQTTVRRALDELVLDGLVIWLVGVPFTAAGAFLLHLPVYFVYALTLTEEVTKVSLGLKRYFSKKWINDLTGRVEEISPG